MKLLLKISALSCLGIAMSMPSCSEKSKSGAANDSSEIATVHDPDGVYKLRSDASITKRPADGVLLKTGNVIEFHYDGSKGDGLDYQLYYIDSSGSVHPMTGSNFENKGNGVYSRDITIFNSSAHLRPGFMEVTTVSGSGIKDGQITGKNVSLGMYSVTFEVTK